MKDETETCNANYAVCLSRCHTPASIYDIFIMGFFFTAWMLALSFHCGFSEVNDVS